MIILTASSTNQTKLEALEAGATDLLSKPVHRGELLARIRNVLNVKTYQDQLCRYSEELESAVRERTADLEASRLELIHCLARAAEFRDDDTGKHIVRVGRYARIIGEELGLSPTELDTLQAAAQLHDVGKIGIRDSILLKPGKLTPEEFETMQKHCAFGRRIVDNLTSEEAQIIRGHTSVGAKIVDVGSSPILKMAKRVAMTHHERWDGTGYPLRLAGEDIPLEGRITAVADVFDALNSKRSYKHAFSIEKCFEILKEARGTQFDPAVVDAFVARRDTSSSWFKSICRMLIERELLAFLHCFDHKRRTCFLAFNARDAVRDRPARETTGRLQDRNLDAASDAVLQNAGMDSRCGEITFHRARPRAQTDSPTLPVTLNVYDILT